MTKHTGIPGNQFSNDLLGTPIDPAFTNDLFDAATATGLAAPAKHVLHLTESAALLPSGSVEQITVTTKGWAAGTLFNYVLSGAGTDQLSSSLTGSVVIDSTGHAYIDIDTIAGDVAPQGVTLTLANASATFTIEPSTTQTYNLTSSVETLALKTFDSIVNAQFGTVTAGGNEGGGTLAPGDSITGYAGGTTTLNLLQNNQGSGNNYYDLMPQGVSLNNISAVVVNSVQAVGSASQNFDTTGIDGGQLSSLTIQTSLGQDYIKASQATNVSVTDFGGLIVSNNGSVTPQAGAVDLLGGDNDVVTAGAQATGGGSSGDPFTVTVTGASGTVNVANTATNELNGATSSVTVIGGTNINVSGYGAVNISNVTGTVNVLDQGVDGNDTVAVSGGTNVAIAATYGAVTDSGSSGNVTIATTGGAATITGGTNVTASTDGGAITISNESGSVTANGGAVTIDGGTNVSVTADGAVTIGANFSPSGSITVTDDGYGAPVLVQGGIQDTVSGYGSIVVHEVSHAGNLVIDENSNTTVAGGITATGATNVTINGVGGYIDGLDQFVANQTAITVGAKPVIITNPDGTQYVPDAGASPNGAVVINDALGGGDGQGLVTVYVHGSTSVSITGGSAGGILDLNSIALVQTPGGAPTPGVSTLASVSLNGLSGTEAIQSDALTTLSVINSGVNLSGGVYEGTTSAIVENRLSHVLSLSLNNDAAGTAVSDDTATTVSASLGASAAALNLTATEASALNISGSSVLSLTGAAGLGDLKTITVTGAAGLNDGGTATGLNNYGALASVTATASTGAITIALNGTESFAGGAGLDTVTLTADVLGKVTGGSNTGNVVVADGSGSLFTAKDTGANVRGFSILRTDSNSVGTYDLQHVFDGISTIDIAAAGAGAETFSNAAAVINLSVDESLGSSAVTLLLAPNTTVPTTLNLTLGTADTAGIDTTNGIGAATGGQLLYAQGYKSVSVASQGLVSNVTGESEGTNVVRLGDTLINTLTVTGSESLSVGSTGGGVSTIDLTGLASSATADLANLSVSQNGVTLTAGASGFTFLGNVSSLKTDTVKFTVNNIDTVNITEGGTGALDVAGASANGSVTIVSTASVLLATLGNGNDSVKGSDATTTITAGNGNDTVNVGTTGTSTRAVSVTLGSGGDTVTIVGDGADTVSLGAGTTNGTLLAASTVTVGNGNDTISLGAAAYTVNLGTGNDTVTGNIGAVNAGGVNLLVAAGAGNDTITLGNGTNFINDVGSTGTVNITAGNGNDLAGVGSGTNTVTFGNGNGDEVGINGAGTSTVTLGNGNGDYVGAGNGDNTIKLGNGATDVVDVGNGTNSITVGNGNDEIAVGTGSNTITLGSGVDNVAITGISGAGSFNFISGAAANDSVSFSTAGVTGWEDGSVQNAEVKLPNNATLSDYLTIACSGNASTGSEFAWFNFGGNQYLVENNNSGANQGFVGGTDLYVEFKGSSTLNTSMLLNNNTVTFH